MKYWIDGFEEVKALTVETRLVEEIKDTSGSVSTVKNKPEEAQLVGRCRPWTCIVEDTNIGDEEFKSPSGAGYRLSYESFK